MNPQPDQSEPGRKPAACALCYAEDARGVAARERVRGMMLCPDHAKAVREGRPTVGARGLTSDEEERP
jgi:hypothetical protein